MYQRAYASAERVFGLMETPGRLDETTGSPLSGTPTPF